MQKSNYSVDEILFLSTLVSEYNGQVEADKISQDLQWSLWKTFKVCMDLEIKEVAKVYDDELRGVTVRIMDGVSAKELVGLFNILSGRLIYAQNKHYKNKR